MSETVENSPKKSSKGLIIGIIIAIIVIAGGVAAYTMVKTSSPKAQYFLAEKASFDGARDFFEERYSLEKDWYEFQQENAVGVDMDISGNYTDPGAYGFSEIEEIVNNINLVLETETDMKAKEMVTHISANAMGMKIEDFSVALTENDLFIVLPFLDEVLKINDEDVGDLLKEIDPYTFDDDDTEYDFGQFFDQQKLFTEDEQKYLEDEYAKFVFDELPEDSFTSESEKVKVLGDEVKTEKITMKLNEDQIKEIADKVLSKMKEDDKLKEIVADKLEVVVGAGNAVMVSDMMDDFDDAIEEVQELFEDGVFKEGITSTIWVDKDTIVKRDFAFNAGEGSNEGTLKMKGDQKVSKEEVAFAYEFGFEDEYDDVVFNLDGSLTWKDDQAEDEVTLTFADDYDEFKIGYRGEESVEKSKKDFEREFGVESDFFNFAINWDGSGTYDKDSMTSENTFSTDLSDFYAGQIELNVDVDGEKIKSVEMPDTSKEKDIGKMSESELMKYVEEVIEPNFEKWMMSYFMEMSAF